MSEGASERLFGQTFFFVIILITIRRCTNYTVLCITELHPGTRDDGHAMAVITELHPRTRDDGHNAACLCWNVKVL